MPTLKQGQASDCANPVLVYAQQSFRFPNSTDDTGAGTMFDVDALDLQIWSEDTGEVIAPVAGDDTQWTAVDTANDCPAGHRLGIGRYIAAYTVDSNADPGAYRVRWRVTEQTGDPFTYSDTYYQVIPVTDFVVIGYAQIHDLRCEGVPGTFTVGRMRTALESASRYVEQITGRRFRAEYKQINIDGVGHPILRTRTPIVMIERVEFNTTSRSAQGEEVESTDLRVYNRHIREDLADPDDREAPRVELLHTRPARASVWGHSFSDQQQNMKVVGIFGYTEYDGSSMGRTPVAIREVTMRLAMRSLRPMWRAANKGGSGTGGQVTKEKTRDQTTEWAGSAGTAIEGSFTGDWDIDSILSQYMAPPHFTAA